LSQIIPPPLPDHSFLENATYVLSGGLGGIGRSVAKWMVSKGARNLVFLSRSGGSSEAARALLEDLKLQGCNAQAFGCDVSDFSALEAIIGQCEESMPRIKGCVQGAMQLKDSAFETMPWSSFQAAVLPKVHGSWNLHAVLPEDMDFFVMLSSICGIIGNRGQANYAAGNTYQDALAHYRHSKGLAATAIDLGSMLSVGFIAEHEQSANVYAVAAETIREDELHAILEYHMDPRHKDTRQAQVTVGLTTKAAFQSKGIPQPSFLQHPLFTLLQSSASFGTADAEEESFSAARAAMRSVRSLEEASGIVLDMLVRRLASVMGIPLEGVEPGKPVHYYGVDSLVAVEFRNWLAKNLDAEVEVLDIMGDDSMAMLAEKIAKASKLVPAEIKGIAKPEDEGGDANVNNDAPASGENV
jgi:NAD(P)-dependent dehydrogenase (short-subunit alcohol dehydrogenase family)